MLDRFRQWHRYRRELAELSAEMSKVEWPLSPATRERLRQQARETAARPRCPACGYTGRLEQGGTTLCAWCAHVLAAMN